jgi:hypothetical protein
MMTKKDFKELADIIAGIDSVEEKNIVLEQMIKFCEKQNPRFDENRFREWIRRTRAGESLVGLR